MSALTQATSAPQPQPVPAGHLLLSLRWQASPLAALLRRANHITPTFSDNMGVADFLPAQDTAVVLLTERDLQNSQRCHQRLHTLAASSCKHQVVIMERTAVTAAEFSALQLLAAVELRLTVLPVCSISELPPLLAALAAAADRSSAPLLAGRAPEEPSPAQRARAALCVLPGLGATRAEALLSRFGSLAAISCAPETELAQTLGATLAASVHGFFHG